MIDMKYWAVIGDGNTRKSSAIYSLTGTRMKTHSWQLRLNSTEIYAFIEPKSPQERSPAVSPDSVVKEVISADCDGDVRPTHLMIALRHAKAGFQAIDYLRRFDRQGWTCLGILLTSPDPTGVLLNQYSALIRNAPLLPANTLPSNQIANSVRNHWGL